MRILALDLGSVTGFAHAPTGHNNPPVFAEDVVSGIWRFPMKLAVAGKRYVVFGRWLRDMITSNRVTRILVEEANLPAKTSIDALRGQIGKATMVEYVAAACDIEVRFVPVQTWRSSLGVPQRAPKAVKSSEKTKWLKDQTVAKLRTRGFSPADHNAADAIGVLLSHYDAASRKAAAPMFDFDEVSP